eukprot:5294337-Amphidinium_carterae.1
MIHLKHAKHILALVAYQRARCKLDQEHIRAMLPAPPALRIGMQIDSTKLPQRAYLQVRGSFALFCTAQLVPCGDAGMTQDLQDLRAGRTFRLKSGIREGESGKPSCGKLVKMGSLTCEKLVVAMGA